MIRPLCLALALLTSAALAEDWGSYQIVSVSAPEFVLEAVGGTQEGGVVSINKPADAPNQKWIIQPRGDGWFWLMPTSQPGLALTVDGATTNATLEDARRIRADVSIPQPLLIAVSGWGAAEDRKNATAAGFDHHLVKPAELDEILRLCDVARNHAARAGT